MKPKEKTEAEKRAEAEKAAAEKKAAAERAAAEAAAKKIAGAFGKGTQMGNKGTGTTGSGLEGSPTGNSSEGKSGGVGGYGTFDLNGRSLGSGGLPMPVYNVQDEGRVVVTITVKSRRTGDKYQYQQTYQYSKRFVAEGGGRGRP